MGQSFTSWLFHIIHLQYISPIIHWTHLLFVRLFFFIFFYCLGCIIHAKFSCELRIESNTIVRDSNFFSLEIILLGATFSVEWFSILYFLYSVTMDPCMDWMFGNKCCNIHYPCDIVKGTIVLIIIIIINLVWSLRRSLWGAANKVNEQNNM